MPLCILNFASGFARRRAVYDTGTMSGRRRIPYLSPLMSCFKWGTAMTAMRTKYARIMTVLILSLAFSMRAMAQNPASIQNQQLAHPPVLDAGFHDMYNLQFPEAHAVFAKFMTEHPEDPMGPVSDAAAYLFSEFHRTGVLDLQLFTNDTNYLHHHKDIPDPAIKKAF